MAKFFIFNENYKNAQSRSSVKPSVGTMKERLQTHHKSTVRASKQGEGTKPQERQDKDSRFLSENNTSKGVMERCLQSAQAGTIHIESCTPHNHALKNQAEHGGTNL